MQSAKSGVTRLADGRIHNSKQMWQRHDHENQDTNNRHYRFERRHMMWAFVRNHTLHRQYNHSNARRRIFSNHGAKHSELAQSHWVSRPNRDVQMWMTSSNKLSIMQPHEAARNRERPVVAEPLARERNRRPQSLAFAHTTSRAHAYRCCL